MKWSFNKLQRAANNKPVLLHNKINLTESLKKRYPKEVMGASDFIIDSNVKFINESLIIDTSVKGMIEIPSSRSLSPVKLPLDFNFTETYINKKDLLNQYDKDDLVFLVEHDTIDISKAIVDNILLRIPIKVLSKEEQETNKMPAGKDWEVMSEKDYISHRSDKQAESKQKENPFGKLKNYFDTDESKYN